MMLKWSFVGNSLAALAVMVVAACGSPSGQLSGSSDGGGVPLPDSQLGNEPPVDAGIVPDAASADAAPVDAPPDALADAPPDAPPLVMLTVTAAGSRTGSVTSADGEIACPPMCTAQFPMGHQVALTASPAAGSIFIGWDGACHGVGPCSVTLTDDTAVTARFGEPTVDWARVYPGTGLNRIDQLVAHPSGDLIVAGLFSETVSLGGPTWTSDGLQNPYVVGRVAGSDGHHVWSRALPERADTVAVDHDGNVILVLELNYTLVIDGVRYSGGPVFGAFVLALNGDDGSVRWARIVGDPADDSGNNGIFVDLHAAVAPDGDVVLFGTVNGALIFGSQTFTPAGFGLVLARLAGSDGTLRWVDFLDGPGDNRAGALGVTPTGRILIAGTASGSITFPGQPATTTASGDSFIAALEGDGQHVAWRRLLGGGFTDRFSMQSTQVGALGRLVHPIDLGTGTLSVVPTPHPPRETEPQDAFIAVLDADSGIPAWARVIDLGYFPRGFGVTRNLLLEDLVVSPSSGVVLVGEVSDPLLVADLEVVYPTSFDNGIILTLGPGGAATQVARLGGAGRAALNGIATTEGGIYACGAVAGDNDLGGVPITSSDDGDGLLLRLTPAATPLSFVPGAGRLEMAPTRSGAVTPDSARKSN